MVSFEDTRILYNWLSCLLWTSPSIGNAPDMRCTAQFAVLVGRDWKRLRLSTWNFDLAVEYVRDRDDSKNTR